MSETVTENPAQQNSENPPAEKPSSEPPAKTETENKTEEVTEKLDKVKIEANGVTKASGDPPKKMSSTGLSGEQKALKEVFTAFSKFGDTKSDGKMISLSQSDKWMKQAKVIDGKKITTTDTGISFKKFKALKITFSDYNKFIEDLAKIKKIEPKEITTKLIKAAKPSVGDLTTGGKAAATVDRLTDTTRYTGTHKQRFDSAGRGRGIEGRSDNADSSGYVSGYQNKNTYDKTH